jgi:aryl-alcohol dehydrogenase-like predicted oxidoreductase
MSSKNTRLNSQAERFLNEKSLKSTQRYLEIAKKLNISAVTLAVAYSKQFTFVASTIIGARNIEQMDESLAALDFTLSKETMAEIKAVQNEIMYPMF